MRIGARRHERRVATKVSRRTAVPALFHLRPGEDEDGEGVRRIAGEDRAGGYLGIGEASRLDGRVGVPQAIEDADHVLRISPGAATSRRGFHGGSYVAKRREFLSGLTTDPRWSD